MNEFNPPELKIVFNKNGSGSVIEEDDDSGREIYKCVCSKIKARYKKNKKLNFPCKIDENFESKEIIL